METEKIADNEFSFDNEVDDRSDSYALLFQGGKEIRMKKAPRLLVQLTVVSQEVKQEKMFILQVILLLMILGWPLKLGHLK